MNTVWLLCIGAKMATYQRVCRCSDTVAFMARGGRPVERPAHLLPEQRQQAQQQTIQWRQQCQLSQRESAEAIGVSYSAYRPWENCKDHYAGPTCLETDQLNKALRRLLGDRYSDGEAFDVWGWPREQDMTYDRVVESLRSAGFEVPRLQASLRPPARVLWVHKVRPATLVHGVFSLCRSRRHPRRQFTCCSMMSACLNASVTGAVSSSPGSGNGLPMRRATTRNC